MEYIYSKHFRKFKEFTITNIYAPYRSGGIEVDGKFIPKSFKMKDGKWYEQLWSEEQHGFVLSDTPAVANKEWYKTYKKVFDVAIKTPAPATVDDKTSDEFTIKALGTFKVKEMLREDFDVEIPMDGDNEAFDWEDKVYVNVKGKSYQMKVTGKGLDTKYKFKLVETPKEKAVDDINSEDMVDLPF